MFLSLSTLDNNTTTFCFVSPTIYRCCIAIFVAPQQQQDLFPFLIITLYYEYQLGQIRRELITFLECVVNMKSTKASLIYFEEHNFSGWLIQFKAMLREHECDEIIETPIPKDVDANGALILMNARERQDFNR
jgi:hypothetical protein